jgi:peptide chain release factor subunit 1
VSTVHAARRLVAHRDGHPVVSVYLDLDPERFATPPGRASQVRSLIDQAMRDLDGARWQLDHDARVSLRQDLERVKDYLLSREPPFKGARSLAVFCSTRDGLFETVQLRVPVQARVAIERAPYVEPMVAALAQRRWLVVLVSRRDARLLAGPADSVRERQRIHDETHGQHDQGGWSQARYQRSIEKEVDDHLRNVAEVVHRRLRDERFDRLALGGPLEVVPRLEALLNDEARARLAPGRVDVDVSVASEDEIRAAIRKLVEEDQKLLERVALDRLAAGIGSTGRAAGGPADTLAALNERRVQTLLLAPGFDRSAGRCPTCGLLVLEENGPCPADGTPLERLEHLREAAVEAALAQDATVMVVSHHSDLGPFLGIAALLRF